MCVTTPVEASTVIAEQATNLKVIQGDVKVGLIRSHRNAACYIQLKTSNILTINCLKTPLKRTPFQATSII